MNRIVEAAVGIGRFFYHFVVGDDWVVAAVMLLSLVATAVLVGNGVNAWWLVPVLAVGMTWAGLRRMAPS